jgi:adenylate cyclase
MAVLEAAFKQTSAGRGQVVGLVADAGVGKSRLAKEFLQRVRAAGAQVVETHCPSHGKKIPLLMYLECVRRIYDIDDRDDPEVARGKIESRFRDWFPELIDEMPLVFDFLGVPDPSRPLPPMTSEERQRRLTRWARRAMAARGQRMCWIFLFEDMHWVDPASEALLGAVIEGTPGIRQMVLLTYRPEYTPPWGSKSFYRQVPLLPLTEPAMHDLLEALLGPDLAGSALAERVRDRCMGTPFFVEELIQSLAERGLLEGERGAFRLGRPVDEIPLPPTVQAVLAARIDRLDEREKRVLQAGAVIGKEFSRSLLARVSDLPDAELDASLDTLAQAEFIYEQALYPEVELAFKHPLTQEVALGSQLRERRAPVHEAAAKALEELHADQLDEKAGLLAHHWEQAGDALAAARWHHRAARWVTGKAAQEALHHWRRVRDLTSELPGSDETIALGIASSMGLVTMGWHCGISPEETAVDFARCRELAEQAGDDRSLAILHSNYSLTGGLSGPERIACYERANELARSISERSLRAALGSAIAPFLWAGDLRGGLARSEESLGLIGQDLHLGEEVLYYIPYLWLRSSRAWLLGKLGRLPEAYQEFDRALGAVREHGTEFDQHYAYQLRASIECLSGDAASAVEHGRRAHEMSDRLGGLFLRAQSCTAYGAALVAAGRFELAISLLEEAVETNRRYGFLQWEAPGGHLARAHLACERLDQALATARDAIDWSAHGGFRLFELDAQVALVAILARRGEEPGAIRAAVERADTLVAETGAGLHAPRVEEARALWAQAAGDGDGRTAALREAARGYRELGATGDAQRVARELAS